ncbi:hypothetical protein BK004_02060 [bacterium CG10_46_32]|nr:MAG: hypothetical protein BK004_02060 [bacterium CG10_46_32]PIR56218.1 MAG: hypothetical protein COU73_02085 [Parcubacteria group bacterium CG10_big_fil_rev_8_21_14_0_10_46_32]
MNSFVSKQIISTQTIGEQLGKVREGAGLSLDSLSKFLRIKRVYLEAIESGSYAELPGEIYCLEFIKRYATALRMDPEKASRLYRAERKTIQPHEQAWRLFTNPRVARPNARWIGRIAAFSVVLAFSWYAVLFGKSVLGSPNLEVASPTEYSETQNSKVVISGTARGTRSILLNGESVPMEQDGSFLETLSLAPGYHVLRITALGRAGKENTVYRAVLVQRRAPKGLVVNNNL